MKESYNFNRFKDRDERRDFLISNFNQIIDASETILDVGCSNNELKKKLGRKVTGIDIAGEYDYKIDLEQKALSKFSDSSYNLVICTEVLEHLDNFHQMVDELVRVSNKYIIISLPNSVNFKTRVKLLLTGKVGKYYGLPITKPEDRHKWLFSEKDIWLFFQYYAKSQHIKIKQFIYHYNYVNPLLKILLRFIPFKTFANDCFIVLEK